MSMMGRDQRLDTIGEEPGMELEKMDVMDRIGKSLGGIKSLKAHPIQIDNNLTPNVNF